MTEGARVPPFAVRAVATSFRRADMSETPQTLLKTPLHALHVELSAKMVPFAGYDMPVQYPAGVLKEHLHTREKAGLFDVSHMGQAFLAGADPAKALERLTPADVVGLKPGMQRYGLLLNDQGTIKDDFMFSKLEGEADMYLVVNAGTKDGDYAYIADKLKGAVTVTTRFDRALLALQGPMAGAVLERLSPGIDKLTFMKVVRATIAGRCRHRQPLRIYRRGRLRNLARGQRRRARCGARFSRKPKFCPSVSARGTRCVSKQAFVSTAMTSTRR